MRYNLIEEAFIHLGLKLAFHFTLLHFALAKMQILLYIICIISLTYGRADSQHCVEVRPLRIVSESRLIRNNFIKFMKVWGPDACVSLTNYTDVDNAIVIKFTKSARNSIVVEPYQHLLINSTDESNVNIPVLLTKLFKVPFALSLADQQHYLQNAAFELANVRPSIWAPDNETIMLAKADIVGTAAADNCEIKRISKRKVVVNTPRQWYDVAVARGLGRLFVIRRNSNDFATITGALTVYHKLPFSVTAIAWLKSNKILFLDELNNLFRAPINNVKEAEKVYAFNVSSRATIFSTADGIAYAISANKMWQISESQNGDINLVGTNNFSCLLRYFEHVPVQTKTLVDFTPEPEKLSIADDGRGRIYKDIFNVLLSVLQRVHPELLLVCLVVLVPLIAIALPLLALLLLNALRLHQDLKLMLAK